MKIKTAAGTIPADAMIKGSGGELSALVVGANSSSTPPTGGGGGTPGTPTLLYTDDFNRTDGPLGDNWTAIDGATIVSDQMVSATAWVKCFARWTQEMNSADHKVVITLGGTAYNLELSVRDNNNTDNGTRIYVNAASEYLTIATIINGTTTVQATSTGTFWPIGVAGDTIALEAIGDVYTLYKNDTPIPGCTWTDEDGVFIGTGLNVSCGVLTDTANLGIDTFEAWDMGAASSDVTVTSDDPLVTSGLYSWTEIATYETPMIALAPKIHRLGTIDDSTFAACLAVGASVMYTVYPSGSDDPTTTTTLAAIDTVLGRYGPGGTYFTDNPAAPVKPIEALEVLNEPNWYFAGTDQAEKAAAYATILTAAYPHIKASWPTVTVVGCSISDASAAAEAFLSLLLTAEPTIGEYMDAFSFHPYTGATPPDQTIVEDWGSWRLDTHFAALRNMLTASGYDGPMWVTEQGFPLAQADGGTYAQTGATVDEAQQAAYNLRFDLLCARQGVPRVYHMYINDNDGYNGGYFDNTSGDPRQAELALKQEIALLGNAKTLDVVAEDYGGGDPFIYKFTLTGKTVQVAWAQTSQTVSIDLPSGTTTVTDMLGNTITTTTSDSYSAALSEQPIFLTSVPAS